MDRQDFDFGTAEFPCRGVSVLRREDDEDVASSKHPHARLNQEGRLGGVVRDDFAFATPVVIALLPGGVPLAAAAQTHTAFDDDATAPGITLRCGKVSGQIDTIPIGVARGDHPAVTKNRPRVIDLRCPVIGDHMAFPGLGRPLEEPKRVLRPVLRRWLHLGYRLMMPALLVAGRLCLGGPPDLVPRRSG